ncbi:MAG: hypothetical protein PHW53_02830 [Patescibacteria group bacterium]|nr:hypothetical protein [Patescibacteria group bacterium]
MLNAREIKVIANYVELDGTKRHIALDVQFQPDGNVASALTAYLAKEYDGKFVSYIVITPSAW